MTTYNAQIGVPGSSIPIGVPIGYAAAVLPVPTTGQIWPRGGKTDK